jgi:acyl carrier protein
VLRKRCGGKATGNKEIIMDVFEKTKQAIMKVQPGIDAAKVVVNARLTDDLGVDSLTKVELALAMEDSFGFYLTDSELEPVVTVGDIVTLIESKLKDTQLRTQNA